MNLKELAAATAEALQSVASSEAIANTGGGSRHRGLPEDLRQRFIDVRAALFARGIYDPVLVRFDTATVPQAPTIEIAERLAALADTL
ncbi:MAG: hypothetical protein ACJ74H_03940 [Thermoanaerobaculia bacterium]